MRCNRQTFEHLLGVFSILPLGEVFNVGPFGSVAVGNVGYAPNHLPIQLYVASGPSICPKSDPDTNRHESIIMRLLLLIVDVLVCSDTAGGFVLVGPYLLSAA